MPGRHAGAARRRTIRPSRLIAAAGGTLAVVLIAFIGARALDQPAAARDDVCSGTFRVDVAAAPEIVSPIRAFADEIADDNISIGGACLVFEVTPEDPAETFAKLAAPEPTDLPDLWVPDTVEWINRTGIPPGRLTSLSPSVAATPLVLASTQATAAQLASKKGSWAQLANATPTMLSNPETSGVAFAALLGLRRSAPAASPEQARREVGGTIVRNTAYRVANLPGQLDRASDPSGLKAAIPTTEQQVLSYLKAHPDADIVQTIPAGGTVLMDYPLLSITHDPNKRNQLANAGATLLRYVDADRSRSTIHNAGFRDYRDLAPPNSNVKTGDLKLQDPLDNDADDVLRSWAAMTIEPKMLAMMDVSGSMNEAAGTRTRIDLAEDALRTAMTYLPDTAELGLWAFSENLGPDGVSYTNLAKVQRLEPVHRAQLNQRIGGLNGRVGRNTALYDTILAGYRTARSGFDGSRFNAVVLITDGKDDNRSKIKLEPLLSQLKSLRDPARPVELIMVGMGPGVDLATMQRIAAATGGRAYRAADPKLMEGIIIDALLRRQCSTGC
jgi:Ca-activated chloride channel homolog